MNISIDIDESLVAVLLAGEREFKQSLHDLGKQPLVATHMQNDSIEEIITLMLQAKCYEVRGRLAEVAKARAANSEG